MIAVLQRDLPVESRPPGVVETTWRRSGERGIFRCNAGAVEPRPEGLEAMSKGTRDPQILRSLSPILLLIIAVAVRSGSNVDGSVTFTTDAAPSSKASPKSPAPAGRRR